MTQKTKKRLTTLLGCVVLVLLLGAVGSLERSCDREECVLQDMDERTYYTILEHLSDSLGRMANRYEVADWYIRNTEGL